MINIETKLTNRPRKKHRTLLIATYIILILVPTLAIFVIEPESDNGLMHELGRFIGVSGLMIILFQFLLSARIKWLDRMFSYANIIRFHRMMGQWVVLFLLTHPFLMAYSEGDWNLLLKFESWV